MATVGVKGLKKQWWNVCCCLNELTYTSDVESCCYVTGSLCARVSYRDVSLLLVQARLFCRLESAMSPECCVIRSLERTRRYAWSVSRSATDALIMICFLKNLLASSVTLGGHCC